MVVVLGKYQLQIFPSYFPGRISIVQASHLGNVSLPGKFKLSLNAIPLMKATWKSCSFHAQLNGALLLLLFREEGTRAMRLFFKNLG